MESFDFEGLGEALLARLRGTGEAFWLDLKAEQVPIVERAARRSSDLAAFMVTDPANIEQYKKDLNHVLNTLLSESAVTVRRAEREIRLALGQTIRDVAAFLLDAVV